MPTIPAVANVAAVSPASGATPRASAPQQAPQVRVQARADDTVTVSVSPPTGTGTGGESSTAPTITSYSFKRWPRGVQTDSPKVGSQLDVRA